MPVVLMRRALFMAGLSLTGATAVTATWFARAAVAQYQHKTQIPPALLALIAEREVTP